MAKTHVEVVKLGRRGELILPRGVLSALGLQAGDELFLSVEEDQLLLRRKARRFSAYLDTLNPNNPDRNDD